MYDATYWILISVVLLFFVVVFRNYVAAAASALQRAGRRLLAAAGDAAIIGIRVLLPHFTTVLSNYLELAQIMAANKLRGYAGSRSVVEVHDYWACVVKNADRVLNLRVCSLYIIESHLFATPSVRRFAFTIF